MDKTIAVAPFPQADEIEFATSVEKQMELFQSVVNCIRIIRKQLDVKPSSITPIEIYFSNAVQKHWFENNGFGLAAFVVGPVAWLDAPAPAPKPGVAVAIVTNSLAPIEIHVTVTSVKKSDQAVIKIEKEIAKHSKEIAKLDSMLNNTSFMKRAPSNLVLKTQSSRDSLIEAMGRLEQVRKSLK